MLVYTKNNVLVLSWVNEYVSDNIHFYNQELDKKWSIVVDFLDRVAGLGFGKHCCANLIVRCVRE